MLHHCVLKQERWGIGVCVLYWRAVEP